jgi:hypothetical protein
MLPLGLVTDSTQRVREAVPLLYTAHSSGPTGELKKREGWLLDHRVGKRVCVFWRRGPGRQSVSQSVTQSIDR